MGARYNPASNVGTLTLSGTSVATTGSLVAIGSTTQTTVGTNGAASALTALPLGYIVGYIGTTKIALPYYNG